MSAYILVFSSSGEWNWSTYEKITDPGLPIIY
jgi:hypothetical protein